MGEGRGGWISFCGSNVRLEPAPAKCCTSHEHQLSRNIAGGRGAQVPMERLPHLLLISEAAGQRHGFHTPLMPHPRSTAV